MKIEPNFEIVQIADDYMLVPVGDKIEQFNGTVVLNEVAAFLVRNMKTDITEEQLIDLVMEEYEVDKETAKEDIEKVILDMKKIGIIHE